MVLGDIEPAGLDKTAASITAADGAALAVAGDQRANLSRAARPAPDATQPQPRPEARVPSPARGPGLERLGSTRGRLRIRAGQDPLSAPRIPSARNLEPLVKAAEGPR